MAEKNFVINGDNVTIEVKAHCDVVSPEHLFAECRRAIDQAEKVAEHESWARCVFPSCRPPHESDEDRIRRIVLEECGGQAEGDRTLERELSRVMNGRENDYDLPDFVLAGFLTGCLDSLRRALKDSRRLGYHEQARTTTRVDGIDEAVGE